MRLLLRPSLATLFVVALAFAGADTGYRLAGDSFFPGGALDETAHLLTALLVMWALGRVACDRFLRPALVASVLIDLDHIPGQLGYMFFTRGTPRPYTHALLTVAVVLGAAALWRSRRDVFLGIAGGLVIHFWRDMSESTAGIALLWPFSDRSFMLSHGPYLAVMGGVVAVVAARCVADRRERREPRERRPDRVTTSGTGWAAGPGDQASSSS